MTVKSGTGLLAAHTEESFRLLVESERDHAIFLIDIDGTILTWNIGAERLKQYRAGEIIGKNISVFYPPEDLAWNKPRVELTEAAREGRFEDEGFRLRKDGTRFWANVVLTALYDARRTLIGYSKIIRDFTARKAVEEKLRQSEMRLRLLIASIRDYAVFMLEPDGRVATWNKGAEAIKGYRADEIIGKPFTIFYPEVDVRVGKCAHALQVASALGRFEDEGWRVRKDGSCFWANVVISAVRDDNGKLLGFSKVTRDLTERRRSEDERTARVAAEQSNLVKDEFLATVSHELRTPLNAILGWTLTLRPNAPPAMERGLAVIERNARAQSRIIEDLLDFSLVMSEKLKLEPAPIDVGEAIMRAVEELQPAAAAKEVALRIKPFSAEHALVIPADKARLNQILFNLLTNGVKFTPQGGFVEIGAERADTDVAIHVRDSGEGIRPEFLPHVFDPFWQADSSTTRKRGGLGLGLSLVKKLTVLHGGSATASSAGEGQGTTVIVRLPL